MSIDSGMDKEDVVHIYNGILLSHKKEQNMPVAATWMDLEMIILSQTKTNIIWYHSYVESNIFKNYINELIYKTETDSQISKTNLRLPEGKPGEGEG